MARPPIDRVPPGRWQVVERNRRLEVIDRQTGQRLAAPRSAEPIPPQASAGQRWRLPAVRQTRFDGGGELTTHRLFDAKAPRTIQLDAGSAAAVSRIQLGLIFVATILVAAVIAWPWLLVALAIPLNRDMREPIRGRITNWLDRAEREGS